MGVVEIMVKRGIPEILFAEEIRWFMEAYSEEQVPDYQIAALMKVL